MKKLFFSVMLILTVFTLSVTCAFAAVTTDTDYISYDFTGNTVTNGQATDIPSINYVPKDGEENNPYTGEIVYGVFGKDSSDAVYKFTSEWNSSSLPTDTSIGTNIKTPFIQFTTGKMTTIGTDDIVHVSYDMYIDGDGMKANGELRPYKVGTTALTRFSPSSTYTYYSSAGFSQFFGESITSIPFKSAQWRRVDIILDAQATAIVDGETLNCTLAYLYIDGALVKGETVLDGDNETDGYQTIGGLDHVRFFLNPKAVDGVFPKTSTYLDNITVKIHRDGTMPAIYPEATLISSYTTDGKSVIDNTKNIAVVTGYSAAEFLSSITVSDSYTYNYSIVDSSGNAIEGTAPVKPGYYLRAANAVSGDISYYLFTQNFDANITSDTVTIKDNSIFGYKDMALSELTAAISFPYGSTYEIKDENSNVITDLSVSAKKGMTITVTSEDKANTTEYTISDAYRSISVPIVTSAGYATDGKFATGEFIASVDISNFTKDALKAKVIVAQYSAAGRLKAYGMSSVVTVSDTETLTAKMNVKSISTGDSAKVFVWDSLNAPLTDCATLYAINSSVTSLINTYPTYTTKALSFSFDDGAYGNATAGDKRIIDIFDKYGVKATWNLIASRINENFMNNYAEDYFGDGDEVANHGYAHRRMAVEGEDQVINGTTFPAMTLDDCKYEVGQGVATLEEIFDVEVKSMIWPYGAPTGRSDYAQLLEYMKEIGIKYARPVQVNGKFTYPTNWYDWRHTANILEPDTLYLDSYLALNPLSSELNQFTIWGHAYELTGAQNAAEGETYYGNMDYDRLDAFCKAIYDEGETWFATNMELYDYYTATNALRNENGVLYNDTDIDLYAVIDGQQVKIPAHGIGGKR